MLVLGIESTCDETAAAVVRNGREILTHVIASQAVVHEPFGGVVPELASRHHLDRISEVVRSVDCGPIDRVAVAQRPGLLGSLLVGINFAKGLALSLGVPLVGVDHVEAHLYAAIMGRQEEVEYPALGVVLSGGHTALFRVDAVGQYTLISTTIDDGVGEAYDKVASLLDLPYPGGPHVERLALSGDPTRFKLKAGRVKTNPMSFSFSGLKTNVLYEVKGQGAPRRGPTILNKQEVADVAAAFQETALGDVVAKMRLAKETFDCRSIMLGGGVTANSRLKEMVNGAFDDTKIFWPAFELSLDNAAMIAGLAFEKEPSGDIQPYTRSKMACL